MFGKDGKKKELIKNLGQIYDQLQREHQISPGDFPELKKMQELLVHHDFTKFHPLKPRLLEVVDRMLAHDIAQLMAMVPHDEVHAVSEPLVKGLNLSFLRVLKCVACIEEMRNVHQILIVKPQGRGGFITCMLYQILLGL